MTSDYGYPAETVFGGIAYVKDVHSVCRRGGCQYSASIRILDAAQQALDEIKEREHKVASEWCEIVTPELPEGHPFNGNKGKAVFNRTIYYADGHMDSGSVTMCIKHGEATGLMPAPKDDVVNGEITSGLDHG